MYDKPDYRKVRILDQRLAKYGLKRVEVPIDGNCFFHAIVRQIRLKIPSKDTSHWQLRQDCVDYLRINGSIGSRRGEHWSHFLEEELEDEFLERMGRTGEWVDHVMVQTTATVLNCTIKIITTSGDESNPVQFVRPKGSRSDAELTVGHVHEKHYFSAEMDDGALDSVDDVQEGTEAVEDDKNSPIESRNVPLKSAFKTKRRVTQHLHPQFENHRDSVEIETTRRSVTDPNHDSPYIGGGNVSPNSGGDDFTQFSRSYDAMTSDDQKGSLRRGVQKQRDVQAELKRMFEPLPKKEIEEWDTFEVIPPEDEGNDTGKVFNFFVHVAKYFSVLVFGGIVLLGGIASMGSLLVVTNALSMDQPTYSQSYCGYGYNDKYKEFNGRYERYTAMFILMLCLCFPEALAFGYSMYRVIMKHESPIDWKYLFLGLIPEVLHAVGITFLLVKVIPYIDATLSVLFFSFVGFVPALLHFYSKLRSIRSHHGIRDRADARARRLRDFAFAVTALILQPAGIVFLCWQIRWTWDNSTKDVSQSIRDQSPIILSIYAIVSLVLISFRYWENFITANIEISKRFKLKLLRLHRKLDQTRFKTGAIYALVRILVIVGICFLIFLVIDGYPNVMYKDDKSKTVIYYKNYHAGAACKGYMQHFWNAGITHCFCGLAVFFFGRIACQTQVQVQAYAFPLTLVSPIMVALTCINSMFNPDPRNIIMYFFQSSYETHSTPSTFYYSYIGWTSYYSEGNWVLLPVAIIGLIAGWLTVIFLTFFLWRPQQVRLARTEALFVKPIYGGILISQDCMLNRRQYQKDFQDRRRIDEEAERQSQLTRRQSSRRSTRRLTVNMNRQFVPQVFLCATMWHETDQEMTQLLTSIMRLDKDQVSRRPKSRTDADFYNFQVHVMFDDAMAKNADGHLAPNKWVNTLIDLIPVAADKVEVGKGNDLIGPVVYPTPYGGRLEFVLPWGNMLHVHLKDKSRIRHRKRWSQCMYMYYILGYLQQTKKQFKKEDVFVLALDGDVDFQPKALLLLLDRMKRNPDVGAACGRIHPVGSGPVVWFQKFEYAVGHWLQKTAEHVLGCVLCSPGCFSLFRGEALMDVNVVNMYTTKPSEARHYIQWDQGEDRWLCTLLLKQGWRIEYSAASDSFTFAPEDFKEFYNQRRRWGPSTMANIFDILQDAKVTVRNNDYISWGYIAYQMGLMASSILGPATVVLVVQGAFQYVFGMTALASLLLALIPVVIFIILCYTTKPDFQIAVAGILTIIYALVMMAVLVGIIGQMTDTLLNPNSIFMLTMIFMYAFTGIIHPTEMMCLMHGILYYLCVPSAFILLMVYSLCNMNNVTWGTREVASQVQKIDDQEQKKIEAEQNAKKGKKNMSIADIHASTEDGGYSCGCGDFCKISCCGKPNMSPPPQPYAYQRIPMYDNHPPPRRSTIYRPVTGVDKDELIRKYSMAKANFMGVADDHEAENYRKSLHRRPSVYQLRNMQVDGRKISHVGELRTTERERRNTVKKLAQEKALQLSKELEASNRDSGQKITGMSDDEDDGEEDVVDENRRDEEKNEQLYWILDGPIQDGMIEYLDDKEHDFWAKMIKKYLEPLVEDKKEKTRIATDLKALKNKMTGAYFLINALWIVLTFSLTLAISDINITFTDRNGEVIVLQPLAFLFLIFFLVILVIQFLTMLVHRWSTFIHLMSTTSFRFSDDRNNVATTDEERKREKEEKRKREFEKDLAKKNKKKNKKEKDDSSSDDNFHNFDLPATSAHDNDAYEEDFNNFTYGNQSNGNGHVYNYAEKVRDVDNISNLDQPTYTEMPGSLKWKQSPYNSNVAFGMEMQQNGLYKDHSGDDAVVLTQQPKSLNIKSPHFSDDDRFSDVELGSPMVPNDPPGFKYLGDNMTVM